MPRGLRDRGESGLSSSEMRAYPVLEAGDSPNRMVGLSSPEDVLLEVIFERQSRNLLDDEGEPVV